MLSAYTSLSLKQLRDWNKDASIGALLSPFFELDALQLTVVLDDSNVDFEHVCSALMSIYFWYADFRRQTKATRRQELDVYISSLMNKKLILGLEYDLEFRHEFSGEKLANVSETANYVFKQSTPKSEQSLFKLKCPRQLKMDAYISAAVGGTFNLLHIGHKLLLSTILMIAPKAFIGVTVDQMNIKKTDSMYIESIEARKVAITQFVSKFRPTAIIDFVSVTDNLTGWDLPIECLVVSEETEKAIERFNQMRETPKLPKIEGVVVPLFPASEGSDHKESSSDIRKLIAAKVVDAKIYSDVKAKYTTAVLLLSQGSKVDSFPPRVEASFSRIAAFYSESHRFYHTLVHVHDCLDKQSKHFKLLTQEDSAKLTLALVYHDMIYVPGHKNNELLSARLMAADLTSLGVPENVIQKIHSLIMLTTNHNPALTDKLSQIMNEIDLSILTDPPEKYIAYSKNIREEYRIYSDDVYRHKRIEFLKMLLNQATPFYVDDVFEKALFLSNLNSEIDRLKKEIADSKKERKESI